MAFNLNPKELIILTQSAGRHVSHNRNNIDFKKKSMLYAFWESLGVRNVVENKVNVVGEGQTE